MRTVLRVQERVDEVRIRLRDPFDPGHPGVAEEQAAALAFYIGQAVQGGLLRIDPVLPGVLSQKVRVDRGPVQVRQLRRVVCFDFLLFAGSVPCQNL